MQDGRIHIDKINYPFMDHEKAKPSEYGASSSSQSGAAGSRRFALSAVRRPLNEPGPGKLCN
ncbi:hypothetical protein CWO90_15350 [Bradyrhizobium sp. Leo121]|nr:hypothetical protein CWO90_15350 [Bradyrhizobium sp. Leo121]